MEAHELSAAQIAAAVRSGQLSAVAVAENSLERIRARNGELNCFLEVWEKEALEDARRIDAGGKMGPLAGVPVAIKDNMAFAGRKMSCASKILEGYVSPYDSTVVSRLK